jgi:hypothetical protein
VYASTASASRSENVSASALTWFGVNAVGSSARDASASVTARAKSLASYAASADAASSRATVTGSRAMAASICASSGVGDNPRRRSATNAVRIASPSSVTCANRLRIDGIAGHLAAAASSAATSSVQVDRT